jgi:hypothetical protein
MSYTKPKRVNLIILLCLTFALLIVVGIPLFVIDNFANEDRDYKLSDEMHKLAQEIKEYKQQNGKYPVSIAAIRSSNNLCVTHFYPKCRKVYYKPSQDLQDYRMAMYSFSWPILFYHPQISMKTDELSKLSKEEQDLRTKQYGTICYFCMSYPPGSKELQGSDTFTPVYRETAPIFANPGEWPEL